jgi:hypothetical protein
MGQSRMAVSHTGGLHSNSCFRRGHTLVLLPLKPPLSRPGGEEAFSAAADKAGPPQLDHLPILLSEIAQAAYATPNGCEPHKRLHSNSSSRRSPTRSCRCPSICPEAASAARGHFCGPPITWQNGGCPLVVWWLSPLSPKGCCHCPPKGAMVMTFVLFSGEQLMRTTVSISCSPVI